MRKSKFIFWTIFTGAIFCFLFRGWIYRCMVNYRSVGLRGSYEATSPSLKQVFKEAMQNDPPADVASAIQYSLSWTRRHLEYSLQSNVVDPNVLVNHGKAHCVGYAQFFATAFRQMIPSFSSTGE